MNPYLISFIFIFLICIPPIIIVWQLIAYFRRRDKAEQAEAVKKTFEETTCTVEQEARKPTPDFDRYPYDLNHHASYVIDLRLNLAETFVQVSIVFEHIHIAEIREMLKKDISKKERDINETQFEELRNLVIILDSFITESWDCYVKIKNRYYAILPKLDEWWEHFDRFPELEAEKMLSCLREVYPLLTKAEILLDDYKKHKAISAQGWEDIQSLKSYKQWFDSNIG